MRTLRSRERSHRPVELFARARMTRTEKDLVLASIDIEKGETRRVAVDEVTRKVELVAKSRAQPRGADALFADPRIFLQHYGR